MKMNRAVVWFPECQINTPPPHPPPRLLSSHPPTPPPPLVLFFAAIIFPFSSSLLRLKNWHVFDKGKSTPDDKSFSPYLGLFFPLSLSFSWVENEQHSLLSLLYSRSKESIIVTTAIEKSHKDSVSALLILTRAETKSTCGNWDEIMSK